MNIKRIYNVNNNCKIGTPSTHKGRLYYPACDSVSFGANKNKKLNSPKKTSFFEKIVNIFNPNKKVQIAELPPTEEIKPELYSDGAFYYSGEKQVLEELQSTQEIKPQSFEIKESSEEYAKKCFSDYQYQSDFINHTLRSSGSPIEAAGKFRSLPYEVAEYGQKCADFILNGYDTLSKPLDTDLNVVRYVYSNDCYPMNYKVGDIIEEKGFVSTTTDLSPSSYAKMYVTKSMKDYNKYSDFQGELYTMEIELPKGSKVIKDIGGMQEVLLKYNSKIQICGFDPETKTYKCCLVN